jgi:hypothetical protein
LPSIHAASANFVTKRAYDEVVFFNGKRKAISEPSNQPQDYSDHPLKSALGRDRYPAGRFISMFALGERLFLVDTGFQVYLVLPPVQQN